MDGYLKIKTKIDNSDVDKEIQKLEDKINKLQIDNSKQSEQQNSLQAEIDKYKEMCNQANVYKQKLKDLEIQKKSLSVNGILKSSQVPEYQSIVSEINHAKAEQTKLNAEIDKQTSKIGNVYTKLEQVKNKQTENNAKISEYRQQIEQINTKNIQNSVDSIGNGITGQIKKVGKLAMAVIGVRSAWMAVRGIINSVKQYNPQISADFEYMGFAIAQIAVPAVQKLVQILYTILSYVNAITSAWFGINIFSNASVKAFQKMKAGANGTAKAMKEINKSRETFDEMNVLSDNSNSASSAGSGVAIPSTDLSGMQGEVPAWLQWIIDNKDLILSILGGIAAGVLAIKFGIEGIKALGIGVLIAGIIKFIQDLQGYLNDSSWENFGKIITDIGLIILGLGLIIGGPAGLVMIISGAIATILGLVVSNWEKIKGFLQKGIDWLTNLQENATNLFIKSLDWIGENFRSGWTINCRNNFTCV